MGRAIVGVIIASVVVYVWGFVYWGMGPYGTYIWKQTPDDRAAGERLRVHFPENGTYFVPAATHDEETKAELFEQGPVALVHMLARDGRPMVDASMMAAGFLLNMAVIAMIAVLLHLAAPALPSYGWRLLFVTLAGAGATLLFDGGDIVWWQIPWQWKVYQAFYSITFWVLTGGVLAAFVGTRPRAASAA